ncbi:signal peptidase II [Ahrensia marina]|uniref:signal peptidase II n=1 Tax=Ahrensia marina TaxID=1514904 RepID=UPI0035D03E5E
MRPAILGSLIALTGLVVDQVVKTWLLFGFDLGQQGRVFITPFFDLVLVWNRGISYGLFAADSQAQVWFLVAVKAAITLALIIWLVRNADRLTAIALGLLIGGAIGNTIDRVLYGAVVDYASLHALGYYWYVFNLADVWVVAGVALLLYDAFLVGRSQKVSGEAS